MTDQVGLAKLGMLAADERKLDLSKTIPASTRNSFAEGSKFSRLEEYIGLLLLEDCPGFLIQSDVLLADDVFTSDKLEENLLPLPDDMPRKTENSDEYVLSGSGLWCKKDS